MKKIEQAKILKNERYAEQIYEMVLFAPEVTALAKAGQFINIYTGKGEMLLPRPISLCEVDKKKVPFAYYIRQLAKEQNIFLALQKETA